jgi:hypothetical protein
LYPLDIHALKFETTKPAFANTGVSLTAAMLEGKKDFCRKAETFCAPANKESAFSTLVSPYTPTSRERRLAEVT